MAEAWLSTVEKRTEFFATDQIEASARRTKFVLRASKITGKAAIPGHRAGETLSALAGACGEHGQTASP